MPDLLDRLKTALTDRYAIEEEVGAATVYLAEGLKHHRKVAVKVLRPELAAMLGPERFLRLTIGLLATLVLGFNILLPTSTQAQAERTDTPRAQVEAEWHGKHGTIGIAASGPHAGLAIFRALQAAEKISTGSIRGVAVMWAMTDDGTIHRYSNMGRGGTFTLFIDGEDTGVDPPPEIADARIAGLISTGPREPNLDGSSPQYPAAGNGVGLVVGHRFPGIVGESGLPVNHEVFLLMQEGLGAREAMDRIMTGANLDLDVGLIAVDRTGQVAMKNSALVDARYDYGRARGEDRVTGAQVETIMNEIHPPQTVAKTVVDVALEVMTESRDPDFEILLRAGTKVELGDENAVFIDSDWVATRITTTVAKSVEGSWLGVQPYILSEVIQGETVLGWTIVEPLTEMEDGVITRLSTRQEFRLLASEDPRWCRLRGPYLTVCDLP